MKILDVTEFKVTFLTLFAPFSQIAKEIKLLSLL